MKCVVITGSTKGIGLGLAEAFLERNCTVVISGRTRQRLESEVLRLAQRFGDGRVLGHVCDVTDYAQVRSLWQAARHTFGHVDIWINNAGIDTAILPCWEIDAAEIAPVVDTNLTGTMYGCHVALQGMQAQGYGQIYTTDGYGSNDMMRTGFSVYGATKRAIRYFTEALEQEAESLPVQIGRISPGMVVTDFMIDGLRTLPAAHLESFKAIYNLLADPVEIVAPFLADGVLATTETGAVIAWLTEEKIQERFSSEEYAGRDLFSRYGL